MRGISVGVWALLASGVGALCVSAFAGIVPEPPLPTHPEARAPGSALELYRADSLANAVGRRDPFRTDRRPAAIPYDATRGAGPVPEGPPKPQLVLTGVVWGDEPEAVVEGLPTASGPRVVRVGDMVGGVTIQRIDAGRVVATGFDTTWALTVRLPWQRK